jgi:hypothetical protein
MTYIILLKEHPFDINGFGNALHHLTAIVDPRPCHVLGFELLRNSATTPRFSGLAVGISSSH